LGGQVVNPQDNESQQEGDFKSRKVEEFLQMYAFLKFIKSLPNPSPKNNHSSPSAECGIRNAKKDLIGHR